MSDFDFGIILKDASALSDYKKKKVIYDELYDILSDQIKRIVNIDILFLQGAKIPGGGADEYKEMAVKFGEFGLIDKEFANTKLKEMAKYSNRVVHFYSDITPEETYNIIHNDLGDFDIFLAAIKDILQNPEKHNLKTE